jgi:hypothetical protein
VRAGAASAVCIIESSTRVDWLPITVLLDLLDATLAVLGPAEAATHWRRSTLHSMEIPLVKPFVTGALSLFNPSPTTVMPLLPKLLSLLYRNIGGVAVEVLEPGALTIVHSDLPSVMLSSSAWSPSMSAAYEATLLFLRAAAPKVTCTVDATQARCTFHLRWNAVSQAQ